jgi:hypothetical protein
VPSSTFSASIYHEDHSSGKAGCVEGLFAGQIPPISPSAQQRVSFFVVFQHWTAMLGPNSFDATINMEYYVRYFGCCARILMPEEEFAAEDMAVRLVWKLLRCLHEEE